MTRSGVQIEDDVRIVRAPTVVPRDSGVPCDSAAGTGGHPVRRIARDVGESGVPCESTARTGGHPVRRIARDVGESGVPCESTARTGGHPVRRIARDVGESGVPCESTARTGGHPVRRIARVVGGWTLLAIGGALLVLPGPGLLVIAGGLALLATEYDWAARLLRKAKERIQAFRPRGAGNPRTDDAEPREPTCGR